MGLNVSCNSNAKWDYDDGLIVKAVTMATTAMDIELVMAIVVDDGGASALFRTSMQRFVTWYAAHSGNVFSSPFRIKHVLALIQCFLKRMMIVTSDILSVHINQ